MVHACWASVLLLLALACSRPDLAAARTFTCRAANHTVMPFCAPYVPYQIASDSDDSQADSYALNQHAHPCPFYAYTPYACRKFFPECFTTLDASTNVTETYETHICIDTCMRATTANNGACKKYFTDAYFVTECGTSYYSNPPRCVDAGLADDSFSDGLKWRIGLGVGLGSVGLILLGLILRRHLRDQWSAEKLAAYDDAKAKKLREAKAKAKRAEEAKQAKQAKKNKDKDKYAVEEASVAVVPGAAAAGAAAGPGRPRGSSAAAVAADPGLSSGRLAAPSSAGAFSDIELGAAPSAAPAAASAAASSSPRPHRSHKSDKKHKSRERGNSSEGVQSPNVRKGSHHHKPEGGSARAEGQQKRSSRASDVAAAPANAPAPTAVPLDDAWKSGQPTRVAMPEEEV